MKYVNKFNNPEQAKKLLAGINSLISRKINLMEVCGTHTVAMFRLGIRGMLPDNINILSGPGCPVCVTSQKDIDKIISLAGKKDMIIATFGDMIKVPGTASSLAEEKAKGADIRVVYSPSESLHIARNNPGKKVIFLAIGFETTSPLIALCVQDAGREKLKNYFVLCSHKLVVPAMSALMETKNVHIDGFICPGHVSITIGADAYNIIAEKYGVPCVIAGFEASDILQSIYMLLKQIKERLKVVEVQYNRVVSSRGNLSSQQLLSDVFTVADAQWRGLGTIPCSGLRLRKEYSSFDADRNFNFTNIKSRENPACSCGAVLRGVKKPPECKLFGKSCTPENPYGPCMVSTEGACSAYYKYSR